MTTTCFEEKPDTERPQCDLIINRFIELLFNQDSVIVLFSLPRTSALTSELRWGSCQCLLLFSIRIAE